MLNLIEDFGSLRDIIFEKYEDERVDLSLGEVSQVNAPARTLGKVEIKSHDSHSGSQEVEPKEVTLVVQIDDYPQELTDLEFEHVGDRAGRGFAIREKEIIINQIMACASQSLKSEHGELDNVTIRNAEELLERRANLLIVSPEQYTILINDKILHNRQKERPFMGMVSDGVNVLVSDSIGENALLLDSNEIQIAKTEFLVQLNEAKVSINLTEWCSSAPRADRLIRIEL